jgi:hypothetical protein
MFSDGVGLERNDDSTPCALCERVKKAIDAVEQEEGPYDLEAARP